jgi:hypothetical protein
MRPARKARRGRIPGVSTDEQRSAPGCSAGRMSQDFGDATLGCVELEERGVTGVHGVSLLNGGTERITFILKPATAASPRRRAKDATPRTGGRARVG